MIEKNKLFELFEYRDGNLYWKIKSGQRINVGSKVGYKSKDGYIKTSIKGKSYSLHRLIFFMHYGFLPKIVDHIDNNKENNKIENLRQANYFENSQNKKLGKSNTSGIKNVRWSKQRNKWLVEIDCNNKRIYLGGFKDLELAQLVAVEARDKYHGKYAKNA